MFDPRRLCCSSLTKTVGGTKDTNIVDSEGGTKDTNIVDSESPYRGTNQMASLPGMVPNYV